MVMEEVMVTVTMMGVMGIVMDTQVMHEPRNILTIVRVSQKIGSANALTRPAARYTSSRARSRTIWARFMVRTSLS